MPSTDGEPSAGVRNLTNNETTMRHTIAMALAAVAITAQAQSTTYNHDPMKMNQITVMESGSGQLQPDWYYSLLHENYSKGAASTNKAMYRTEAGGVLYLQLPTGDSIKTYLEKRAEIEALNMADRAGGAADLAWLAEGEKIERKMEAFKTNVERIVPTGGTGMSAATGYSTTICSRQLSGTRRMPICPMRSASVSTFRYMLTWPERTTSY